MGRLDVAATLSIILLIGLRTGFTSLASRILIGCIGSKIHDNKAFAIIIKDNTLKNHMTPVKRYIKTK